MTAPAYPKRSGHFAHRFCRLMGKVCLGGEIGPEACWLLAFVAHTEDACGYRRPVIFFNEDLATRTGLSVSAMRRARARAVKAGWLVHLEGAKRRPGQYFVVVPEWARGLDDAAGDEGADEVSAPIVGVIPRQADATTDREATGTRPTTDREATGTRPDCEQPSSQYPRAQDTRVQEGRESPEPAPPASEPPVMTFPCVGTGAKEWHLSEAKLAEYRGAFPDLDVLAEFRKALQWVRDRPRRKKTHAGMPAFLGGWLGRAQNRNPAATGPPPDRQTDYAKRTLLGALGADDRP